jgi:hypothetical protein
MERSASTKLTTQSTDMYTKQIVHVQTQIQDLLSHSTPINQVGSNMKPPNGYSKFQTMKWVLKSHRTIKWVDSKSQKTIFFTCEMILIVRLESPLRRQSRSLVQ